MTLNFRHIGLLYHPKLPQTRVMVAEMLEYVEQFGASVWVGKSWEEPDPAKISQTDLLITLGGDGSILRAARMTLGHPTAILGINMGTLGFLAEIEPSEWEDRFAQMLTGEHWIEQRMILGARVQRQNQPEVRYTALNDMVVSRGGMARVVRLQTTINDKYLTTYTADGIVLATPTGSTAYALAAGGPILPPSARNIVLVPVAPHLSLERALVLSQQEHIGLTLHTDHTAIFTIDGQLETTLEDGDRIEIFTDSQEIRFLRLKDRAYFYETLMSRLGWK